jgi:hypothetical protein
LGRSEINVLKISTITENHYAESGHEVGVDTGRRHLPDRKRFLSNGSTSKRRHRDSLDSLFSIETRLRDSNQRNYIWIQFNETISGPVRRHNFCSACFLLHHDVLIDLLLYREDGGNMYL